MLKHEVKVADEWYDNGPQELIMVSLCIQIAIDENAIVFVVRILSHTLTPPPPWSTLFTTLTSAKC